VAIAPKEPVAAGRTKEQTQRQDDQGKDCKDLMFQGFLSIKVLVLKPGKHRKPG
jgi:hypothetical protein